MADPTDPDQTLLDDYFGPMTPDWVPEAADEAGVPTIVVPVTRLYNDPLYGRQRGVAYPQGSPARLRLVMYAPATGAPVKFAVGSYSTAPAVEVRYREATGVRGDMYVPDAGDEGSLAADGTHVVLPVPLEVRNTPGVYRAQARVATGAGVEAARDEFWVYVQRGFWAADGSATSDAGPPTLQEVRTALRDHPGANRLLGEYEFDPAEVGQALVSAVQAYNGTHPTGGRVLDTTTFPTVWRRQWLDGTLAYLFETAAAYFRRGNLPYSAGGVSVNDLAKERDYLTAAELCRQRFTRWAETEKARQSVAAAWGSQGSGAPRYGSW